MRCFSASLIRFSAHVIYLTDQGCSGAPGVGRRNQAPIRQPGGGGHAAEKHVGLIEVSQGQARVIVRGAWFAGYRQARSSLFDMCPRFFYRFRKW